MTHQGFAGSIGTSALLVGAAVTILLVVGAFLAFEGFPGPSGEGPAQAFLLEASQGASERPDPQLVLPPASGSTGDAASATAATAAVPDDFFTPPDSAVSSAVPAAPAAVPSSDSVPVDGGPGPSTEDERGGLGSTLDRVSEGVRSTSSSVDGLADSVLPGRNDDAVSRTTSPLVDTVDGLGSTLDRVGRRLGN